MFCQYPTRESGYNLYCNRALGEQHSTHVLGSSFMLQRMYQGTIGLPLSEWRHHDLKEERTHPQQLPSQAAQRTGILLTIVQDTTGAQEVKWSFCIPTAIPVVVSSEGSFVAFFLEPHGDAATFIFSFHCLCCS